MNILVTGGAGYIGSHAVRELVNRGHSVTVLDTLGKGHREAVDPRANLIVGSTGNYELLRHRLHFHQIEAVMHFAADIEVGESVALPWKYYSNNFSNTLTLLHAMTNSQVKKILLSSTAAVYGNPSLIPIEEDQQFAPINPYGRSKMMAEMALEDFRRAHGLGCTILRYFNVAGASPDASIGEDHEPESHLIPRLLQALRDEGEARIFGADYPTPDGTCIRDYVHVVDLAAAHVLAIENMKEGQGEVYNIGSEKGFSVRQVIRACEEVTGKKLSVVVEERRAGDPAVLIASSRKIRQQLHWKPMYPDIKTIVEHAWHWHSTHPGGFRGKPELPDIPAFSTPH